MKDFAKTISFFSLLFFSSAFVCGQKNGEFLLMGSVLENEAMKLEGATVTVYEDEEKIFDTITSKKGRYELTLQMNKDYTIEFSKSGYVSKSISVSTDPPGTCTIRKWSDDIGAEVSLFKFVPGVNYAMFKRPIAYFEFTEKCSFQKDEVFADKVKAMQNKVRDQVTEVQKQVVKNSDVEDKVKQEQEKQKVTDDKYKQLIASADEEFNDKNYDGAKLIYTEALKLKPGQLYPETQLTRIEGLLAEKQKALEKQKQEEATALKNKKDKEKPEDEEVKEAPKTIAEKTPVAEDAKKDEKKTEALLQRLSDDSAIKAANAELERQREIERTNDLKSILAYTNAKRIFLEEIADSKMKMKQQAAAGKR